MLELAHEALRSYKDFETWLTSTFNLDWDGDEPSVVVVYMFPSSKHANVRVLQAKSVRDPSTPRADLLRAIHRRGCVSCVKVEPTRSQRFIVRVAARKAVNEWKESRLSRLWAALGLGGFQDKAMPAGGAGGPAGWPHGAPGKCTCQSKCLRDSCPCYKAGLYCGAACRHTACRKPRSLRNSCRNGPSFFDCFGAARFIDEVRDDDADAE